MDGRLVIPDASVLLKWVLRSPDEADTRQALALKSAWLAGTVDLMVPTLWAFEVGNVLGLKQPATADALLAALIDLEMPEAPVRTYVGPIVMLMRTFKVTFYDAAYHALAIGRGGVMLTADRQYVRKSAAAGHLLEIADWRPPPSIDPADDGEQV